MRPLDEERKSNLNTLWEMIKSSALIQSVLIVGLCLAVYWIGPISTWETNDDVYYNLLFSGQLLTSAPEAHAVVVNFVLSSFFTQLYTFAPSIPWYGFFHVTSLLLSVWFLNYCYALTHDNDKLLLRTVLSLATILPFLFLLQFTKTASVLAVAGYLGLYLLNQVDFKSQKQCLLLHSGAVLLLIFSFTLRKESFLLMTLLCSLLLVSALVKRKRALIIALSALFVLILAVTLVHKLNYGEEWKDFYALGRAMGPIIDFNQYPYEANKKIYADAGLSRNDYYFLKSWAFADSHVYNPERFDFILANAVKAPIKREPVAALQGALSFPGRNYILTVFGLAFLSLIILHQKYKMLNLYVILPFLLCTGMLAWQGRFPTRVSSAMVFFLLWALVVFSGEMRKRFWIKVASTVAFLVLVTSFYMQYLDLDKIASYRQAQNRELHRLGVTLSSSPVTLVTFGAAFPYEGLLPFESPTYLSETRILWLCGMNQSPVQKKQLIDLQIDDLFASISDGKTPYVVLDSIVIGILKQYVFEHYQRNINIVPVYNGRTFFVYRVSS